MTYPEYIKKCIDMLRSHGFSAYVVGGAVRDTLLCKAVSDWDVTTSATPDQTLQTFEGMRTIPTGLKHGTVTVLFEHDGRGVPVEITTFRVDGEYLDHRRPSKVSFSTSIGEDLSRRDFTVNAMAFNDEEGLVDLFDGKKDLEGRIIRCVGDPKTRYSEDALRIMRAFRFSSQLCFEIEEKTLADTATCAHLLSNIARERIGTELVKLLAGEGVEYALEKMTEAGIFDVIFGYSPSKSAIKRASKIKSRDPLARLAMLVLELDEEKRAEILSSLRLSNDQKRYALRLCKVAELEIGGDEKTLPVLARRFLADYENICEVAIEMLFASGKNEIKALEGFAEVVRAEREKGNCLSISSLALDGKDVLAIAREPSQVGTILSDLLAYVIEHPDKNEKNTLLQKAKELSEKL